MRKLLQIIAAIALVSFGFGETAVAGSLQARLDALAPGGVLELEPGVHAGPIRIEKAVTINGGGRAVVDGGRLGTVILVDAAGVRLRGLVVRNSGLSLEHDDAGILVRADDFEITDCLVESCLHGIYVKKASGGRLSGNIITGATPPTAEAADVLSGGLDLDGGDQMCAVGSLDVNRRGNGLHLWNSRRVILSGNVVSRVRDGIYFSFTDDCELTDNTVSDCRYGLHYMYSDGNSFAGNRFSHNAAGAALMYSGRLVVAGNYFGGSRGRRAYGALLQSVDSSEFRGNRFLDNTVGLYSENSQDNTFTGNVVERNYIGIRLGGSSRGNLHGENSFRRNIHAVESAGQVGDNSWSVQGRGNRWDGFPPPDLDADGIGEFPHREADLLGRLRQRFPLAGFLSGSPGLELVRFAHARSALPWLPAIEDPHPLSSHHD